MKVLHGEAGSADRQWVSVARAVLPTLLKGVERENIWNADELDISSVHFQDVR
jgi:hypothetical protein